MDDLNETREQGNLTSGESGRAVDDPNEAGELTDLSNGYGNARVWASGGEGTGEARAAGHAASQVTASGCGPAQSGLETDGDAKSTIHPIVLNPCIGQYFQPVGDFPQ